MAIVLHTEIGTSRSVKGAAWTAKRAERAESASRDREVNETMLIVSLMRSLTGVDVDVDGLGREHDWRGESWAVYIPQCP